MLERPGDYVVEMLSAGLCFSFEIGKREPVREIFYYRAWPLAWTELLMADLVGVRTESEGVD
jgi:hypothetical protein